MAASTDSATSKKSQQASAKNDEGLVLFAEWEIDKAIAAFKKAAQLAPDTPDYHLNLARAYARGSSFHQAIQAIGEFLRTETDDELSTRYERLFSSALDDVETLLISKMRELDTPVPQIGKAIQMWLEYRITLGRETLDMRRPALWAAALALATYKVNVQSPGRPVIANTFGVSESALKKRYEQLVAALDLMPGDYRYFTGEDNPLDKLVEAAQELENLYNQFYDG